MASSRSYGLLAAVCAFLTSCAGSPNTIECASGVLCPEGMQCAAFQPVCLVNNCGNGKLDLGEVCDDGNIVDGDGCSSNCLSNERCGNGMIDQMAGEICDPPKERDPITGVGCSADCKSNLTCGNGIKDVGEACDDGNNVDADGCNATCSSTEVCGNGIKDVEVGEACDDGNTVSGDGCNSDCRSGEGCGNGILDPGEECDDGNMSDNDDCLHTCKRNVCGDGIINSGGTHKETCDAGTNGTPVETATCNLDCTVASCGDGKVNQTAGEECDDGFGNNKDTNNCVATCKLNICGDGKVDMQPPRIEQCDDGNTNNADGCNNACQLASCGNGQLDVGEQCDDGNNITTDACVACHNAICGDGFLEAGIEQCDDGNTKAGDGCSPTCRTEGCGNGQVDPGEQCDDGNIDDTDTCLSTCKLNVCGDGKIHTGVEQCDDGNKVSGDGCSATCLLEGCGNGTLDPGEQCDDGNKVSGDGCSMTCQFEACGDGVKNNGEQCDTGGESATCNADCTLAMCGDSKVNSHAGEQCDQGAANNSDMKDCTASCKINVCGDGKVNSMGSIAKREQCDDGNTINNDGCSNACMSANCGNGVIDPGEECDDMNANNTDGCVSCKYARCGDGFVEVGVEECDGPGTFACPKGTCTCSPICRFEFCGNSVIDAGEECDDGGTTAGDGCDATCHKEFCGDSHINNTTESCEIGLGAPGVVGAARGGPDCPYGATNCLVCPSCQLVSGIPHVCGDGNTDTMTVDAMNNPIALVSPETCDDGDKNIPALVPCAYGTQPCRECVQCVLHDNLMTGTQCGDNVIQTDHGEQCDGPMLGGATCASFGQVLKVGKTLACNNVMTPGDCTLNVSDACQAPTCMDLVLDQNETDIGSPATMSLPQIDDCGGPNCGPCATGKHCVLDSDCATDFCSSGTCAMTTCGNTASGTVEGDEVCDYGTGKNDGKTCANGHVEVYGDAPCIVCDPGCTGYSLYIPPHCGDGTCQDASAMPAGPETKLNCPQDCTGCGNGIVESGEDCDNGAGNTNTQCATPGYNPVAQTCSTCDTSCVLHTKTGPSCGDTMLDSAEECDDSVAGAGAFHGSNLCSSKVSGSIGTLGCSGCQLTYGGCSVPPPPPPPCVALGNFCNGGDCCSPNSCDTTTTHKCIAPPPVCSDTTMMCGGACTPCGMNGICTVDTDCTSMDCHTTAGHCM